MAKTHSSPGDRPILSITSPKILGMFSAFLAVMTAGFLFLVVHIWDDINKHLDRIDAQLAGLSVTQGKFEQFLTSELPAISQDLRRNTDLLSKLEGNVTTLTQSVAQVQRQVSIATEEIEKLKEQAPVKKGALDVPRGTEAARLP